MNALQVRKMTYAALCLAIAMVLPFITGQIPEIGSMLCPMHIPALLCGFICGWPWGVAVGFIAPLLRSARSGCLCVPQNHRKAKQCLQTFPKGLFNPRERLGAFVIGAVYY